MWMKNMPSPLCLSRARTWRCQVPATDVTDCQQRSSRKHCTRPSRLGTPPSEKNHGDASPYFPLSYLLSRSHSHRMWTSSHLCPSATIEKFQGFQHHSETARNCAAGRV